ncbi:MAG: 4-deoxy-4-formamido-L-arabinose-phosphoundecaprenol deformylase, partial [Methylobacter sp.]
WQDFVASRDAAWSQKEMQAAIDSFQQVFGHQPLVHGAAGWQLNKHTLQLEQQLGFRYASDCRGQSPFIPQMQGETFQCPQIPTTLPTLDELLGCNGITEANVHEAVFASSRKPAPAGHVYTLHAELEGMKLLPVMEKLLQLWRQAGDDIGTLKDYVAALDVAALPRHELVWGEVEGRSGVLAVQGQKIDS